MKSKLLVMIIFVKIIAFFIGLLFSLPLFFMAAKMGFEIPGPAFVGVFLIKQLDFLKKHGGVSDEEYKEFKEEIERELL